MTKNKFTFRNYVKELKKTWLLLAIFTIIGAAGGAFYAFKKPVQYTATSKAMVYNAQVDNGSVSSAYSQISQLLLSESMLKKVDEDLENLPEYTVTETLRGVFEVTVTASSEQEAKDYANKIIGSTEDIIKEAYEDYEDYHVTILDEAKDASATVTTKSRIISIAIAAVAMFVIGAVIVFIKFDYNSEK